MIRRSMLLFSLMVTLLAIGASVAAAGPAVKLETVGLQSYTGIGVDYEFNGPFDLPATPFVEAVGWVSMVSGQPTHGQIGAGARIFMDQILDGATTSSEGAFIEAKFRLFAQGFHPDHKLQFSYAGLIGLGYRTQAVLNGLDIVLNARITQHHVLPAYSLGVRFGF